MFYKGKNFSVDLEDLGDTWQLEGIAIGNGHGSLLMETANGQVAADNMEIWKPTVEELESWLRQSDDPVSKLYHDQDSKVVKAVVRKSQRQLDQVIVWKVYERDNYACVYCGTTGVPLTYDHYLAQAYGGLTSLDNGRTSCRPCNKLKGHMTVAEWQALCTVRGLNDGADIKATAGV